MDDIVIGVGFWPVYNTLTPKGKSFIQQLSNNNKNENEDDFLTTLIQNA